MPSNPSSPGIPGGPVQEMYPIQPMMSNQSNQSNQSSQSVESARSQNSHTSSVTSGHTLTNNAPDIRSMYNINNKLLAPPQEKGGKSRRWSLTGRFFEKRKSITEPFHVPGSHSQDMSASYNPTGNNIVRGDGGSHGEPSSQRSQTQSNQPSGSKQTSPPGSNGSSRRSSLADIPKAFLSSLRRGSVTPSESKSVASTVDEGQGGEEIGIDEDATTLMNGQPNATMAHPKAPPKDPWTLANSPAPKSILKKRPTESATGCGSGAGGSGGGDPTKLSSLDVHPMATSADVDLNLLTPTDHRARLLTHSPTPNHPQQHLVNESNSPDPPNGGSNSSLRVPGQKFESGGDAAATAMAMSIPPDVSPGVQSNSKDRESSPSPGSSPMPISSRAQVLANQYYGSQSPSPSPSPSPIYNTTAGTINGQGLVSSGGASGGAYGGPNNIQSGMSSMSSSTGSLMAANGAVGKRRSINFLETIEIIPAHRKADYNRQSDKHATFKVLTPDLKSEIRDELNTYKMREMAVHVESMGNTAFH
ncbi:hypothetical protein BGZ81_007107 [Podila clonocystis]|nr:hypothetical protein BGZ81_007107 [Podila clonocystis]